MPFKKGTSGNPIGRPKGSVSTTTKLIREHISQEVNIPKKALHSSFESVWLDLEQQFYLAKDKVLC